MMISCKKINNHNNKNYIIIKSLKYPLKAILAFIIDKNLNIKTSISSNNCKIEFGDIHILVVFLPKRIPASLEEEFFPSLIGKGLYGYRCEGEFIDIGTTESYSLAADIIKT